MAPTRSVVGVFVDMSYVLNTCVLPVSDLLTVSLFVPLPLFVHVSLFVPLPLFLRVPLLVPLPLFVP